MPARTLLATADGANTSVRVGQRPAGAPLERASGTRVGSGVSRRLVSALWAGLMARTDSSSTTIPGIGTGPTTATSMDISYPPVYPSPYSSEVSPALIVWTRRTFRTPLLPSCCTRFLVVTRRYRSLSPCAIPGQSAHAFPGSSHSACLFVMNETRRTYGSPITDVIADCVLLILQVLQQAGPGRPATLLLARFSRSIGTKYVPRRR